MSSYLSSRAKRCVLKFVNSLARSVWCSQKWWESGVARSCAPSTNYKAYHISTASSITCPANIPASAAISNSAKYLDGSSCCFVSGTFFISKSHFQPVFRQTGIAQRAAQTLHLRQQFFHTYSIVADSGLLQLALRFLQSVASMNRPERPHAAVE